MVVSAVGGALGFLSRLPVGHDEHSWEAFRARPVAFPLAGYVLGTVLAVPLLLVDPVPTAVAAYVVWLYLVTGVTHADALADFGDAMATHGDAQRRRESMTDTALGVGGVLALTLGIVTLALAGLWLASLAATRNDLAVLAIVVASEVGAKTAMATVVCLGTATHEGLGSALTGPADRRSLWQVGLATLPVVALAVVTVAAPIAAGAAIFAGAIVLRIARSKLGGVSGDVIGTANEIGRLVGLHAGVVAWTHL